MSQSTGELWTIVNQQVNKKCANILLHHIFFNITKFLISIEKKKTFKYYKIFKLEGICHTSCRGWKFWAKPEKWHVCLSNQALFWLDQKLMTEIKISWDSEQLLRWNEKHFSLFLKGFQLPKIIECISKSNVSNLLFYRWSSF